MVKLVVRDRESIQEAVRRFRKLVERSGIKKEMRRREFYEKPSETNRRARLRVAAGARLAVRHSERAEPNDGDLATLFQGAAHAFEQGIEALQDFILDRRAILLANPELKVDMSFNDRFVDLVDLIHYEPPDWGVLVERSLRLTELSCNLSFIDHDQRISLFDAVTFLHPDFFDGTHKFAGQGAGRYRLHRSHRFIGQWLTACPGHGQRYLHHGTFPALLVSRLNFVTTAEGYQD